MVLENNGLLWGVPAVHQYAIKNGLSPSAVRRSISTPRHPTTGAIKSDICIFCLTRRCSRGDRAGRREAGRRHEPALSHGRHLLQPAEQQVVPARQPSVLRPRVLQRHFGRGQYLPVRYVRFERERRISSEILCGHFSGADCFSPHDLLKDRLDAAH